MGRKLNARIQHLLITGAGVKPTVPSPVSIDPTDSRWRDSTDIMRGEWAFNQTDGKWYYRTLADVITELNTGDQTASEIIALLRGSSTLTDGAAIAWNIGNKKEHWAYLETAESAPAITISNADTQTAHAVKVKKTIAGDTTITFTGTGYKFVDMDNKAAPVASLALDALRYRWRRFNCKR